jgi:hypothetical protein
MYNACDKYLNGKGVNQQEVVPYCCINRFGLDDLDLSCRNIVEMKLLALRSLYPVEIRR